MNINLGNWKKLSNREYRHALAAAQFKRFVPFQIGALRKERKWSQEKLAAESGLTQGVISKAEDPDNGNLAVNTILRIANGLDVVFVGKFVPYTEFEEWRRNLSEQAVVLGFDKENEQIEKRVFTVDSLSPLAIEAQQGKRAVLNIEEWQKKIRDDKQKSSSETLERAAAGGR